MNLTLLRPLVSLIPPNFLIPTANDGDIITKALALGPIMGPAKLAETLKETHTNIQGIWKLEALAEQLEGHFSESTQIAVYDILGEFRSTYGAAEYGSRNQLISILKLIAAEGITETDYYRALHDVSAQTSINIDDLGPLVGPAVKFMASAVSTFFTPANIFGGMERASFAPKYVQELRYAAKRMGFRPETHKVDRLRMDIDEFYNRAPIAILRDNESCNATRKELIRNWESRLRNGDNSILSWVGLRGNYANGPANYRRHLDTLSAPWHQYLFERGILNGENVADERLFWGTGLFFAPLSADNRNIAVFGRFTEGEIDPLAILKSRSVNGKFQAKDIKTYGPHIFSANVIPAKAGI